MPAAAVVSSGAFLKLAGAAMSTSSVSRAVTASGFALLVWGGCVLMFMPPFLESTTQSIPKMALLGIAIGCSLVLHLVFLGIAAKRAGRMPALWVLLAIFLMPIGSIVGLILLSWFDEERASVNTAQA
jgi:hypothetical protein